MLVLGIICVAICGVVGCHLARLTFDLKGLSVPGKGSIQEISTNVAPIVLPNL